MIRVASYCRVSTDKDDQVNSFDSQCRFFGEYVANHPGWELYDIYADEGITGTSTRKRIQFNRMINDAYEGKFNMIITKEVSRFSRNILDAIRYTRELKALGIGVIFLTDGFSTLDPDAELRLSIMGSLAQEESRKTSARVKWGQTRRMEQGVVFGRSMLGYDVMDGRMTVDPEGADLVRLIFHKYGVEKKGTSVIARELMDAGYRTYSGNHKWSASHIIKILRNEKYVGDLVQKKTFTPDYLSHVKKVNHGEESLVSIENHHEPIISRELWDEVQAELSKRGKHRVMNGTGHSNRYIFSGKIKCAQCGASFVGRQKTLRDGTKIRRWSCATAVREGSKRIVDAYGNRKGCDVGILLRDDDAVNMLRQALTSLQIDKNAMIRTVAGIAADAIQAGERGASDDPERLQFEIDRVGQKKSDVMDAFFSEKITEEDMLMMKKRYDEQIAVLKQRIKLAQEKAATNTDPNNPRKRIEKNLKLLLDGNRESEILYKILLDHTTVQKCGNLELRLNHLPHIFRFTR